MAKIGTAYVDVVGNFKPLQAQLATQQSSLASRLAKVGKAAAIGVAGVGAAATKMAFDYEEALEKVHNLVGVNAKQTEEWGEALLDMAPKVGKAPQELADALYFVSSSGIEANKVLNTTKISAQASALGLGETETVANALTSAMNAYSKSGLSARDATNVLIQTVKFGKLEADELAGSIGRVIPVASQLKIPFEDVGAALATMSLSGLDAAEATTALRGIMNTFIKPSAEANDALRSVGLSAEDIRERMAKPNGVLDVLRLLDERFHGNVEAMGDVFPNIRALTGVFNLLGNRGSTVNKVFEETNAKTDDLGKSWEEFKKTPAQQMRSALAGIQAAMVDLGQELLPEVSKVFREFSRIITDDKLSGDEKVSGVIDLIVTKVSDALPKVVDLGAKIVASLGKGIISAFTDMNLGQQVLAGTALLGLFGGKGAIMAAGASVGRFLGVGIGAGATSALTTGLAGGAGAAGAGGIGAAVSGAVASGFSGQSLKNIGTTAKGGITNALKKVRWGRIGGIGVGLAVFEGLLGDFETAAARGSGEWEEALQALTEPTTGETVWGFVQDAFASDSGAIQEGLQRAERFRSQIEEIFSKPGKISIGKALRLKETARELGLTGDAYDAFVDDLNAKTEKIKPIDVGIPDIGKLLKVPKKGDFDLGVINDVIANLEELPPAAQRNAAKMAVAFASELERKGDLPKGAADDLLGWVESRFGDLPGKGVKAVVRMVKGMGINLKDLPKIFRGNMDATTNAIVRGVRTGEQELGHLADVGRQGGKKAGEGLKDGVKDGVRGAQQEFNKLPGYAQQATNAAEKKGKKGGKDTGDGIADGIKGGVRTAEQELGQLPGITDRETRSAEKKSTKNTKQLKDRAGVSFHSLAMAAANGFKNIGDNVNKALKALQIRKPVNFGIEVPSSKEVEAFHQRGGLVLPALATGGLATTVPGHGAGDRHILSIDGVPKAKVESKEGIFVGNRHMMAAAKVANDQFPRFQQGGVAEPPGDIGSEVVQAAYAREVGQFLQRFHMNLTQGYNPSGPSVSPGHLSLSAAPSLDVVPLDGDWDGLFAQGLKWALSQGMQVGYDGQYGTQSWEDHGEGNHAHIDWKSGGELGAVVEEIKRTIIEGPEGPLKDTGQRALDKVTKAANDYLAKQAPAFDTAGIGAGALTPAQFAQAARAAIAAASRVNPAAGDFSIGGLQTLAMAESSLIPSSINNWDSNALAGNPSGGLMHLTQSNFRAYHVKGTANDMFDPVASIAASIMYQIATYGGQVTHSPYARGGPMGDIGELLGYREGGIIDLEALRERLLGAEGPGDRRDFVSQARDQIQKRTVMDQLSADGSEIAGKLLELRGLADQHLANADSAAAYNFDEEFLDDEGEVDTREILGQFLGHNELEWLYSAIDTGLWPLRNKLIGSSDVVGHLLDQIGKLIKKMKKPKGILDDLDEAIRTVKQDIRRLEKDRGKLEKDLEEATENKEKSEKEIEDRLEKELAKPKNKPKEKGGYDEEVVERLRQQLRSKSTERESILELLRLNREQTGRANNRLEKVTAVRDALRDRVTPVLTTREEELASGKSLLTGPGGELETVQGTGIPNEFLEQVDLPAPGQIGGEIMDAQLRIIELLRPDQELEPIEDEGAEDPLLEEQLRLTQEQLTAVQQQLLVSRAQYPVFEELAGTFHTGGIVRAPVRGAEVGILARDQEGVFTEDQMAKLGPGTTVVIEEGAIDASRIRQVAADGTRQSISISRRSIGGRR